MTFLSEPTPSDEVRAKYDADLESYGFVMNLSHVWAHLPDAHTRLMDLLGVVGSAFSQRERGILVTATASTIGDSYCSWAWGWKLAAAADAGVATGVLAGTDEGLSPREAALATWARSVGRAATGTTEADVAALRQAGWTDEEIFRATAFVALRMAFSTVNAALGARPDAELRGLAPESVAEVVTWGRPIQTASEVNGG
jgi:alkylhydroperoxidase family enzyme